MEKKEDRRIAMTKRLLKAALIELLKEQDIYHISIRELCERADVNRTTFYKYYGSQFDLLTDMEKDMLDFIAKAIERHETEPEKIITAACRYLEENLEFARLIINNNVDPAFAHKLFAMDSLKESARKMLSGSNSEAELAYVYNFLTFGAFRMVCVWLNKEEREPPDLSLPGAVQQILILPLLKAIPSRWMWLTIVLSFGFYIPVVLWADAVPLIGMLMIPKTCAYVWTVLIGYSAMKKECG